MHDSAVNTWGIKGYYDYVRPISALRYMAGKGQSSNASLPSYDPHGLPLIPGLIEIIDTGDPLAGFANENLGKIKVYAWRGPDYITDPETDVAGVGWILASRWWPYQRATFVTPPFAGYVSGHSTFSRAAAETLTMLTGDEYFPGGMGTFDMEQNNFLFFEQGPSENMTLQWATYRDASDQTSLSRIWGGIHPPIDDIRGRIIGEKIGIEAFNLSLNYFNGTLSVPEDLYSNISIYPNPTTDLLNIRMNEFVPSTISLHSIDGKQILSKTIVSSTNSMSIDTSKLLEGIYLLKIKSKDNRIEVKKIVKQ